MRYNHLRTHHSLNNITPAEEFYNFQRKLRWRICHTTTRIECRNIYKTLLIYHLV